LGTSIASRNTTDGTVAATASPEAMVNTASSISRRAALSLRNGAERNSQAVP
jgi:hypothetical protein